MALLGALYSAHQHAKKNGYAPNELKSLKALINEADTFPAISEQLDNIWVHLGKYDNPYYNTLREICIFVAKEGLICALIGGNHPFGEELDKKGAHGELLEHAKLYSWDEKVNERAKVLENFMNSWQTVENGNKL